MMSSKDYDLDHLTNQFEEVSLDIKTNPSVFFTNLTKINKKFAKFKESGGKDYAVDTICMNIMLTFILLSRIFCLSMRNIVVAIYLMILITA